MPVVERKALAQQLQAQHGISIVVSCQIVCISRTDYYYVPKLNDDEASMPPYLALTTLALRIASLKQSPGLFLNVTHYRKSSSLCHADDIAL